MKSVGMNRRSLISTVAMLPTLSRILLPIPVRAQTATTGDLLPSWNEGPTKQAIIEFVRATTTEGSPQFVPVESRIATFDQDGTLWVEQPMYTQVMYCLERV